MLMMCWFYCIPFTKGLFYAAPFLLFLFSLFVLKRGVRQSRQGLRQLAFVFMFIAALKLFAVDVYMLREYLLCDVGLPRLTCDAAGFKALQGAGLLALVFSSFLIFHFHRNYIHVPQQTEKTPEQAHVSFWANLGMSMVFLLIVWLIAPWAGFLTVGRVPDLFMKLPWQHLAVLNMVVLLYGFWKLEDCRWVYDPAVDKKKIKKPEQLRVWTAKDTLWVAVVLFLITLAFSYASNDALTATLPGREKHKTFRLPIEDIDLGNFKKFSLPPR